VHAKAPMGITRRETTIGSNLVHTLVIEHLEYSVKIVEAISLGMSFDLALHVGEVSRQRRGLVHCASPICFSSRAFAGTSMRAAHQLTHNWAVAASGSVALAFKR